MNLCESSRESDARVLLSSDVDIGSAMLFKPVRSDCFCGAQVSQIDSLGRCIQSIARIIPCSRTSTAACILSQPSIDILVALQTSCTRVGQLQLCTILS